MYTDNTKSKVKALAKARKRAEHKTNSLMEYRRIRGIPTDMKNAPPFIRPCLGECMCV